MSESPPSSPQNLASTDHKQRLKEKMKQAHHYLPTSLKINDVHECRHCASVSISTPWPWRHFSKMDGWRSSENDDGCGLRFPSIWIESGRKYRKNAKGTKTIFKKKSFSHHGISERINRSPEYQNDINRRNCHSSSAHETYIKHDAPQTIKNHIGSIRKSGENFFKGLDIMQLEEPTAKSILKWYEDFTLTIKERIKIINKCLEKLF